MCEWTSVKNHKHQLNRFAFIENRIDETMKRKDQIDTKVSYKNEVPVEKNNFTVHFLVWNCPIGINFYYSKKQFYVQWKLLTLICLIHLSYTRTIIFILSNTKFNLSIYCNSDCFVQYIYVLGVCILRILNFYNITVTTSSSDK